MPENLQAAAVWIVVDNDREGETAATAHRTREGAMQRARECIQEYAASRSVRADAIASALADFEACAAGDGEPAAGDPECRFWVSVTCAPLLD